MSTLDRVVVDGGRVGLAATACVRVRDLGGQVVGSGFLIGPGLVATCAHVVADAVGADESGPAPTGPVPLEFPVRGGAPVARRGTVGRWVPVDDLGRGDVALLRLDAPAPDGVVLPPVRSPDRLWDQRYRTFGFPDGRDDGVWATGLVRAEQATGWYQLYGTPGETPIGPGFSGAPVWDEYTGATIGMTVAADRDPGSTTAYLIPIADVLGLDPDLQVNPYRGLEPFAEEHAAFFHGREPELTRLLDAVTNAPLVAVTGPSGSGKSSLVGAGLVPRLRAAGARIAALSPEPGTRPAPTQLTAAVLAVVDPASDPARRDRDAARIGALLADRGTRASGVAELTDAVRGPANTVVVVDQFEELLDAAPDQARQLLEIVLALAGQNLRTVVTLRAATLDAILTPDLAAALSAGTVLVGPLDRDRLRRVVTGPADVTPGLGFENGLVDRILDEVPGGPSQLPLLESLLARLWRERTDGALTLDAYRRVGGVAGALATHADNAVAATVVGPQAEWALDDLLGRLVAIGPDGEPLRRTVRYLDLPEPARALVAPLAAYRIVVLSGYGADSTVELAHLALALHWPRLRDRLAADGAFLRWRTDLDTSRQRWEDSRRDDDALLSVRGLTDAESWRPRRPELSDADRDYLDRSARRRQRVRRRRRGVAVALAAAVLVAAGLTVVAVRGRSQIDLQQAAANAGTLGRLAADRRDTDPLLAAQLALAGYASDPGDEPSRTALATAQLALGDVAGPPLLRMDGTAPPEIVAAGRGSDTVIESFVSLPGDRVALTLTRDPLGPAPQRRDVGTDVYPGLLMSSDGRWAAGQRRDGGLDLLDLRAPADQPPRTLLPPGTKAESIRFSGGARYMGWVLPGAGPRRFQRLDLASGAMLPDVALNGWKTALALDDPATAVLGRGVPNSLNLVSLADQRPIRPIAGTVYPGTPTSAVTCAQQGTDTVVRVTDVVTGAVRSTLVPELSACTSDAVVSDGRYVLANRKAADGLQRWRAIPLAGGRPVSFVTPELNANPLAGPNQSPRVAMVDGPDGPTAIVTVGPNVLRVRTHAQPDVPLGGLTSTELSSDRRWYVTSDANTTGVRVTDPTTGRVVASLPRVGDPTFVRRAVDRDMWVFDRDDSGRWGVVAYTLPGLTRRMSVAFAPGPGPGTPSGVSSALVSGPDGGIASVIGLVDGVLSTYDPGTGTPVGPPVTLARTAADQDWYDTHAFMTARAGFPGQVLVSAPNGRLQLWDVPAGRMLREVPLTVSGPSGDADGLIAFDDRAVGTTRQQSLLVYDLNTGQEIGEYPYPQTSSVIGTTDDGTLLTKSTQSGTYDSLVFYDLAAQRITASMPAPSVGSVRAADGYLLADGFAEQIPLAIPVDPNRWRESVCRVVPPDPSPDLLALLPDGARPDECD